MKRLSEFDLSGMEELHLKAKKPHFKKYFLGYLFLTLALGQHTFMEQIYPYIHSLLAQKYQQQFSAFQNYQTISEIWQGVQAALVIPVTLLIYNKPSVRACTYFVLILGYSISLCLPLLYNDLTKLTWVLGVAGGLAQSSVQIAPLLIIREHVSLAKRVPTMISLYVSSQALLYAQSVLITLAINPKNLKTNPQTTLFPLKACQNATKILAVWAAWGGFLGLLSITMIWRHHFRTAKAKELQLESARKRVRTLTARKTDYDKMLEGFSNNNRDIFDDSFEEKQNFERLEYKINEVAREEREERDRLERLEDSLMRLEQIEGKAELKRRNQYQGLIRASVGIRRLLLFIFGAFGATGFVTEKFMMRYLERVYPTNDPLFGFPGPLLLVIAGLFTLLFRSVYTFLDQYVTDLRNTLGLSMLIAAICFTGIGSVAILGLQPVWYFYLFSFFLLRFAVFSHLCRFLVLGCFYFWHRRCLLLSGFSALRSLSYALTSVYCRDQERCNASFTFYVACFGQGVILAVFGVYMVLREGLGWTGKASRATTSQSFLNGFDQDTSNDSQMYGARGLSPDFKSAQNGREGEMEDDDEDLSSMMVIDPVLGFVS